MHHAMAYICECGEKWVFTRDEVDTKEAHTRACVCGRTIVIQRSRRALSTVRAIHVLVSANGSPDEINEQRDETEIKRQFSAASPDPL